MWLQQAPSLQSQWNPMCVSYAGPSELYLSSFARYAIVMTRNTVNQIIRAWTQGLPRFQFHNAAQNERKGVFSRRSCISAKVPECFLPFLTCPLLSSSFYLFVLVDMHRYRRCRRPTCALNRTQRSSMNYRLCRDGTAAVLLRTGPGRDPHQPDVEKRLS